MPDGDQNEIKKLLADRVFAQPQFLSSDGGKQLAGGAPPDLLKLALETIKSSIDIINKK